MPNLQILRFLAAALVLISHIQHEALKGKFLDLSSYLPWDWIYFAGGVDIFFVISGFIMFAIASEEFQQPGAGWRFFARRLVRIVPSYWMFTTAMIIAAVIFSGHVTHSALSLDHILASYFFLPYENAYGRAYPVLMLGWTLNYEFYFYVVFAVALAFPKRLGLAFLFCFIGVAGVLGILQLVNELPFSYWSNPITLEFLFGVLLAIAYKKGMRLPVPMGWLLFAVGFGIMWMMTKLGIAANFWEYRFLWMGIPALAICAGAVLMKDRGLPVGWGRRQLVLLGDASYAIYLSHPFTLNAVALVWARGGFRSPWTYVCIASIISLIVGVLIHLLIEKPMTAYLNRQVAKCLPPRMVAASPVQ